VIEYAVLRWRCAPRSVSLRPAAAARALLDVVVVTPSSVLHGLDRTVGARALQPSARIDEPVLRAVAQACGYDAQSVSRHFGVSLRHLRRWFRSHLNSSPGVWLAEQRMLHARRLLATSSSVKAVAYSMGFNQLSQFSRDFKRQFGHPPSTELVRTRTSPAAPQRT